MGTVAPPGPSGLEAGDGRPPRPAHWLGLDLKSQSELRIAKALENAGVMFLANARGASARPTNDKRGRSTSSSTTEAVGDTSRSMAPLGTLQLARARITSAIG